jgi:hypothetical protein
MTPRPLASALFAGTVATLFLLSVLGTAPASASAGAIPTEAPAAAPVQGVDSMWVWRQRPAAELAMVAQTLDVRRVFLFVGNPSPEGNKLIRQSVRLLHAEQVDVYALSGEPQWTFRHHVAMAWAHRALRLAPFDGLHLDIEPHALKNWKIDQQALVADYLALMAKLAPLPGPLEVDVQFAYGRIATPGGSTFADDILDQVDGVTVMTYRDTAEGSNGMLAIAEDWLTRATAADKPVWLAAETNPYPVCVYCTFYEEGQAQMASVLADVDTTERSGGRYPTYQGISIEDLDGWLALDP